MTNETQILKKTKQENSNFGKTIKEIWRGTADKWVFIPYLYGVLGIYFIGIIITASQYPNFHIYSDYISYLGSPKHSPAFIVYNTCMMIAGILLIPFYPFMYSHMKITKPEGQRNKAKVWEILLRGTNGLFFLFGIVGCLGFSLLGPYHQGIADSRTIWGAQHGHQITTWMAFGGFGGSALFMLLSFFIRLIIFKGKRFPTLRIFFIPFLVGLLFALVPLTIDNWPIAKIYKSDDFKEWFFMFTVMAWIIISPLIVPNRESV